MVTTGTQALNLKNFRLKFSSSGLKKVKVPLSFSILFGNLLLMFWVHFEYEQSIEKSGKNTVTLSLKYSYKSLVSVFR